jgi:ATP phosphoribosyltransferase regulatory subunit
MSKFEPYDLYADKKDFLVSDNVITFTDTDGTLLALKPDVTLSIIKNFRSNDNTTQKTYYNETVYRSVGSGQGYREIMQTGLECIGQIDDVSVYEVLLLAIKSLETISKDYVLDISHMELPAQILSSVDLTPEQYASVLSCLSDKNEDALRSLPFELHETALQQLLTLIRLYGPLDEVLACSQCLQGLDAYAELRDLAAALHTLGMAERVNLDFSITGSGNYYNGIAFRGYIANVPSVVLSGGQYDRLVRKMGKTAGGIGFAVYLNELDRLQNTIVNFDYDTVLMYDSTTSSEAVLSAANNLRESCHQVYITKKIPENITYRKLYVLQNGRLCEVE